MIKPRLFLKRYRPRAPFPQPSRIPLNYAWGEGGIFETLRSHGSRISHLDRHLDRLEQSVKGLGHELPWRRSFIRQWVERSFLSCQRAKDSSDFALRLAVAFRKSDHPVMILWIRPLPRFPHVIWRRGVRVRTAATRKSHLRCQESQLKSHDRMNLILGLLEDPLFQKAKAAGSHFETIFLNGAGFLTEGTFSNLMIVKNGELFTPAASCGILKGVTRHVVLASAWAAGIPCHETHLTRHDLFNADEAFLTSTLFEIVPVVEADGRRLGDGRPGTLTRRLIALIKKDTRHRTQDEISDRAVSGKGYGLRK